MSKADNRNLFTEILINKLLFFHNIMLTQTILNWK